MQPRGIFYALGCGVQPERRQQGGKDRRSVIAMRPFTMIATTMIAATMTATTMSDSERRRQRPKLSIYPAGRPSIRGQMRAVLAGFPHMLGCDAADYPTGSVCRM